MARLALLACLALAPQASAADPSPFVTDGPVYAIAGLGGNTYIGGAFSHVARRSGVGVALRTSDGQRDTAFPEVAGGQVDAAASDGAGGWYIGGDFTSVGGYSIAGLAHLGPGGVVDTSFHPSPGNNDGTPAVVRAIAVGPSGSVDQGDVYVGGRFDKIGGVPAPDLAAVDPSGTVLKDWSFVPQPNNAVYALAVLPVTVTVNGSARNQSVVFVGGDFSAGSAPAIAQAHLAAQWGVGAEKSDGTSIEGASTGWTPGFSQHVRSLAVGASTSVSGTHAVVYAGGDGTSETLLASSFNAQTDGIVSTSSCSWSPGTNATVDALAVSGSSVYAGGDFTSASGAAQPRLVAFPAITDPTCTATPAAGATGWQPGADSTVRALTVQGSTIYAAGDFANIGSQPRAHLAAIDSSGNPTGWSPSAAGGTANALALNNDGSEIFAGGSFTGLNAQGRGNLAAFDSSGNLLGWSPSTDAAVHALAALGSTVYAGGNFTTPLPHLAAFDQSGNLVPGFNPSPDDAVLALSATSNSLYVGGAFSHIAGTSLGKLAALDPASGTSLASWQGQANGNVYALDASCSTVYVGGGFTSVGGADRDRIAALDPVTGAATGWNPNADSAVYAVKRFGSVVYAGGRFGRIGTAPRSHIAALDASSGAATDWNPAADLDSVRALAVDASTVYVGGIFADVGGAARNNLAAIDPSTGQATSWNPNADNNVYALSEADGVLHAGGSFVNVGTQTQQGFAAFPTGTPPEASSAPCAPTSTGALGAGSISNPTLSRASGQAPPLIDAFRMTHRRFRVGRRATAVVAARHRRRKRAPIGTTFRYRLSEPARTTLTIQQVQVGYVKKARRRGARRCVPAKRLPRRARRCQIRRIVGKLKRGGRAGRNSIAFSGRIGTRPLHAGRYVAILSAVAPDGQKSKPRKLSFQIVR